MDDAAARPATDRRERPPVADQRVEVVIACHDERNWDGIRDAVRSVEAQTSAPDACIVAVDHNPTLAARLRRDVPGVQVVENGTGDRGASATRNAGAAAARGDVVVFLDDDEVAAADWLEQLLPPLADPTVVGTGGRYVPRWEGGRPAWFPDEFAWAVGGHHTGMPESQATVRNVWSGNMAVRLDVFRAVDGFRVGFGKVGATSRPEDTDLCIRMARAVPGGHWVYVPDARIWHAVPARRSTFGFYLRRCYAEGRGKVELQAELGDVDALASERDYLRVTVPQGFLADLREAGSALGRAGSIAAGTAMAGVGGLVGVAARGRRRVVPARTATR